MRIAHWPAQGIVRVDLVDGPDDYGKRVAEDVTATFSPNTGRWEDVLVDIEIEAYPQEGRDVSKIDVEQR